MQADVASQARYGARPVSVDLARGRNLTEPKVSAIETRSGPPLRQLNWVAAADRLALAHWPEGHRISVCSLAGGTGRTTIAGLIATVLAELPYAHVHRPVALVEPHPRLLSTTWRRWGVQTLGDEKNTPEGVRAEPWRTRAGAIPLEDLPHDDRRHNFSLAVIDASSGLPSELDVVTNDPTTSVVLVSRPDRTSLAEAAEALVWMHDLGLVTPDRVVVAINLGTGSVDRGSKAAATALGIRCAAVHRLPLDSTLGPGEALPSGRALPDRVRRPIVRLCLDIWTTTQRPAHSSHPIPRGAR